MSKILDDLPEEGSMNPIQEAALAGSIQKTQDEELKNQLVLANMREAVRYGLGVSKSRIPIDEIFSTCYLALQKAAKNFRPGSIRFFAYSKPYVRGEICTLWKERDTVKNSSLHESEDAPEKRIPIAHCVIGQGADEEEIEYDYRPAADFIEPDFKSIDLREKWNIIEPLMNKHLNEREQMVLKLFYISGFTFDVISTRLVPKISCAAVKHTHARALRKIRSALMKNGALFNV